MPDEELDDTTAASSTATDTDPGEQSTGQTDGEALPGEGGEGAAESGGDSADAPEQSSALPEEKFKHSSKDAIALLSEKTTKAKEEPAAGDEKPVDEAAKGKKAAADADAAKVAKAKEAAAGKKAIELTDEDKLIADDRHAPRKTQRRLEEILRNRAEIRTERDTLKQDFEAVQPKVKSAENWERFTEEHKLAGDFAVLDEVEAAESLKFQAAVSRLATGKGTQADRDRVVDVFGTLDITRKRLGIPGGVAEAAPVDLSKLEKALDEAEESYDFAAVRKAIKEMQAGQKAPAKQEPPPAAPAKSDVIPLERQIAPAGERKPAEQAQAPDADYRLNEARATRYLTEHGVKPADLQTYMAERVLPQIISTLRTEFPKQNPYAVWKSLSSATRKDLTIEAHDALQKQVKSLTPAKKAPPVRQPSLQSGENGKAPWAKGKEFANTSSAAIDRLAGAP